MKQESYRRQKSLLGTVSIALIGTKILLRFLYNMFMFQYASIQNRQKYYEYAKFPVIGGVTKKENWL